MPTYVFKCPKCGHEMEQLMSMGEYAQTPKPKCAEEGCDGQVTMQPQLQPTGFILKGTGWTPKSSDHGAPTDIVMPRKR